MYGPVSYVFIPHAKTTRTQKHIRHNAHQRKNQNSIIITITHHRNQRKKNLSAIPLLHHITNPNLFDWTTPRGVLFKEEESSYSFDEILQCDFKRHVLLAFGLSCQPCMDNISSYTSTTLLRTFHELYCVSHNNQEDCQQQQ